MDSDGTQDARRAQANPVPRPAGPPRPSAVPPRPERAPGVPPAFEHSPRAASAVADWLDEARPTTRPGVWRHGYRPPRAARTAERLAPVTVVGMLVPLVIALVLWSLWRRGAMPYQFTLLRLFTPDDWWWGGTIASPKNMDGAEARVVYDGVFFAVLLYAMGRLGSWPHAVRHFVGGRPQPARALIALLGALAALSFVFPGAFGVGWDALPVVDPLFSLIVLISGGYELFASPCSRTRCTPPSPCWSRGRSPGSATGGRTRRGCSPPVVRGRARPPPRPSGPAPSGPSCATPGSTRRPTC